MTDWNHEMVAARLLEAADTCWRSPRAHIGPSAGAAFWPGFQHDFVDMVGWGQQGLADHRAGFWSERSRPDAAALSREEEMRDLTNRLMAQGPRKILWFYAFSIVSRQSFDGWCKKHGFARASAYRCLDREPERFARALRKRRVLLRLPDLQRVRQIQPGKGSFAIGLESMHAAA